MIAEVKILLLLLARKIEEIVQTTVSRYIIRDILSEFQELPMWKLMSWTYIKNLTLKQIGGLLAIASFTLVTFPLGVWLASFQVGKYYPLSASFAHIVSMVTIPLSLFVFNKTLNEMSLGQETVIGVVIIEVSMVLGAVGWFMVYRGNL